MILSSTQECTTELTRLGVIINRVRYQGYIWIIHGMGTANVRRRYIVTPPLIGWAHTMNDLCLTRWHCSETKDLFLLLAQSFVSPRRCKSHLSRKLKNESTFWGWHGHKSLRVSLIITCLFCSIVIQVCKVTCKSLRPKTNVIPDC